MHFYYNNLLTNITPSSTLIGQKIESITTKRLSDRFKLATNQENIVAHYHGGQELQFFIVDNTRVDGVVTLQANDTDEWTTPSFSQTMLKTDTCYLLVLDNPILFNYYRFVFDSISQVEIGYIHVGLDRLKLPPLDPRIELNYNTTDISDFSISGQVYSDRGYDYLDTRFRFFNIDDSQYTKSGQNIATRKDLISFWELHRNAIPFWAVIDEALNLCPPYFVIINKPNLSFLRNDSLKFDVEIPLREVF